MRHSNEIVKMFFLWRDTRKEDCCDDLTSSRKHFGTDKLGRHFALPYEKVCLREQRWRDYCEERDHWIAELMSDSLV